MAKDTVNDGEWLPERCVDPETAFAGIDLGAREFTAIVHYRIDEDGCLEVSAVTILDEYDCPSCLI